MSTRCRIGIIKDGVIESIYCHNDGYPSGVGKTLFEHYKDRPTVERLLDLGDLSSLGEKPIANPDAWNSSAPYELKYRDDMCITYKTRGETNVDKRQNDSLEDLYGLDHSYLYLYLDGSWLCLFDSGNEMVCEQLEDVLQRDKVI